MIIRMRSVFRLAVAVTAGVVLVGCGSDASTQTGQNAAGEEIGAKMLGIETPNTVKQSGGAYGADIGFAQSTVQSQRKQEEAHGAAIQSLSGAAH